MAVLDLFHLQGKRALVTGGAGLYGRQIVRALAEAGAHTVTAARHRDALEAYAGELRAEGLDVQAESVDQGDEASILALRDRLFAEGPIDILVNNAVSRTMRSWNDDAARFAESMAVNATGLFVITRAFGDAMAEQGDGVILNIGSIQGNVGPDATLYDGLNMNGFVPDYFFHKGGMANFTRFVASYYGPRGVRCNCIHPGGFETPEHDREFVRRYSARTLLGRMAGHDDLMGAVVFLASAASAYITGANIMLDGGYTAK